MDKDNHRKIKVSLPSYTLNNLTSNLHYLRGLYGLMMIFFVNS